MLYHSPKSACFVAHIFLPFFDGLYIESTSKLTVKWYLHVNVSDNLGNPLSDVFVNVTDANNNPIANKITNDRGFTGWIICLSYIQYASSIDHSMNNHSIMVTKNEINLTRNVNISSTRTENFIFNLYKFAPSIDTLDELYAIEDKYYEVKYNASDKNNDIIFWVESDNATWLYWNMENHTINGTPRNEDVGIYWVCINITDGHNGFDEHNFTLTVINSNDAPMINTIDVVVIDEDEYYEVVYNATEIDIGDIITWAYESNASWLNWGFENHTLYGIPNNGDVGTYRVRINISDGNGGYDEHNFTLTVHNVNDPPVITTEDVLEAPAYVLYEVDYNATDIDSPFSQQTWSVATNATWLFINHISGILSGTPSNNDEGWYNVNVSINDGDDGVDWHEFKLVVTPIEEPEPDNDPPEITTIDKVSITAGESYNIIYEATDDRTPVDSLIWSYNRNASWLSFNKISRVLSGSPTLAHVGWYWVNVTVGDGEGGFNSHNFTLTVYATANHPPDILTEDDNNAVVGEEYSVDYEAEDDRTPVSNLIWSLETNASWLSIDKNAGILSGIPNSTDVGSYWVKVSVFDGEEGWDYSNFTLWVTTEPITKLPPELSNPSMTPTSGDTETMFTFSVDYSHREGDLPDSIQMVIDGVGYDMTSSNGHYEYSTKLSEGNHTYYFTTTLGEFTVETEDLATPYIERTEGQPEDGDRDGDEDNTMLYAGSGIVVIIIIVMLILLFIFLKRKKKPSEEPEPIEEERLAVEPTPEEVPLDVPPEQLPAPETPPPEQPPTPPEVTPQVEPQVEPPPQPAPMPKVEEEPVLQVEQPPQPQVEAQEPVVEQPAEPQVRVPLPKIKIQPKIDEDA